MIGKEIKIKLNGKVQTFKVTAENPTNSGMYYFMECNENPASRGFYSMNFIKENSV